MRKAHHHVFFALTFFFLSFPVLFYQSNQSVNNALIDLPILLIVNLFLAILFLEEEICKYRYKSMFLLILASISVLSAFLRMIPLPLGFSFAFLIPICSGAIFGPSFGFLVGQTSMFVSGLFLGAVGPWLPYQALLIGIFSYYSGTFFHQSANKGWMVLYAILISFAFGYWMSVSYWPLSVMNTVQDHSWWEKMESYNRFYMITSFLWDLTRAIGNTVLLILFYKPTIEFLDRAMKRLTLNNN